MYDAFISYRRDGGTDSARLLYKTLTKEEKLNVFFDYEELRDGKFNEKLYDAISDSNNFILVLTMGALDRCKNEEDWVRNEIGYALRNNKHIIPIKYDGFEYPDELGDIEEIRNIQATEVSQSYFDESIQRIVGRMINISRSDASTEEADQTKIERSENKYFNDNNREKELKRLENQKGISKSFDSIVYKKIIDAYEQMTILDIGSNRGDLIFDRFGKAANLKKIMGIEYDLKSVQEANQKYGKDNVIHFYEGDVEAKDFESKIEEYMKEMGIEEFNVVHISMLILHLKKPFALLKSVKKYLSKGGILFIKDIDDGLNLAYPDDNGDFKRVFDICNSLETAGFRHSGRQIYTHLKKAGYKEVILEKNGLGSMEMEAEEREALYDTYFSFVLEDAEIMKNRHPESEKAKRNYEWLRDNYDDLEEKFMEPSFFFNLGFMIFTAHK